MKRTNTSTSSNTTSSSVASLGPSIVIKGSLAGEEDLLIEGRVEGEVSLRNHNVTIGPNGQVKADIFGSSICVEGEVKGHLYGEEQVVIRKSGRVRGNVTAPRVNLEDGAKFKGSIDMQPGGATKKSVREDESETERRGTKSSKGSVTRSAAPTSASTSPSSTPPQTPARSGLA